MDDPCQKKKVILIFVLGLLILFGCTKRIRTTQQETEVPGPESKPVPEVIVSSRPEEIHPPVPAEPRKEPESGIDQSSSAPPPEETPAVPALDDLFFDFDQAAIRPELRRILDQNVRWLQEHPNARITVEGHCDERGTVEYNLALGDRRARVVKQYLEAAGIPSNRIKTISYGTERPFCSGHNEACWQKNRRSHFIEMKGTASADKEERK